MSTATAHLELREPDIPGNDHDAELVVGLVNQMWPDYALSVDELRHETREWDEKCAVLWRGAQAYGVCRVGVPKGVPTGDDHAFAGMGCVERDDRVAYETMYAFCSDAARDLRKSGLLFHEVEDHPIHDLLASWGFVERNRHCRVALADLERLPASNAVMRRINADLGYRPLPAYIEQVGPLLHA